MGKFFNLDNPFWQALNTAVDMILVNMVYILCCIPVVTIGAATSALYTVSMKMAAREEDIYALKCFFKAFAANFKQATGIWLILLPVGAFLLADLFLVNVPDLSYLNWLHYVLLIILAYYILIFSYIFALQSRFQNTVRGIFRNAMLMAVAHLIPWSLLMGLSNVLPFLVIWYQPANLQYLIPLMLVCGFSVIAYVNSKILNHILKKYTGKENQGGTNNEEI